MTGPDSDPRPARLADVNRIVVPRSAIDAVHDQLRLAGANGHEALGFWAGVLDGPTALVEAALVPGQLSGHAGGGLAVVVRGEELFRMNVWLHEHQMRLIAQVHSHPSEAYHSATDDAYATMSEVGGLSIVVPDFARAPFTLEDSAFYRLTEDGEWREMTLAQVRDLIAIED